MSQQIVTWALCVVVVVGAVWVVSLRNLFRAALSLGLVLVGVAGLFLTLGAEFLAFVQILVYVGAVLTLVVFAIMLTSRATSAEPADVGRHRVPAVIVSGVLFGLLLSVTNALLPSSIVPVTDEAVSASALGQALVTTFVLPFEVISVLFVAAMVGAIAVAASPKSEAR
jgi:NADH-quinone oxidoreductase subunit J